ncbi:MAG: hypothetical protein ACRDTN_02970, partial [Mycobacterium sp.]
NSLIVAPDGDAQYLAALTDLAAFNQADWSSLFAVTPTQWADLLEATDVSGFITNVLANQDWLSLLSSLF